jgi:hypothetical protein
MTTERPKIFFTFTLQNLIADGRKHLRHDLAFVGKNSCHFDAGRNFLLAIGSRSAQLNAFRQTPGDARLRSHDLIKPASERPRRQCWVVLGDQRLLNTNHRPAFERRVLRGGANKHRRRNRCGKCVHKASEEALIEWGGQQLASLFDLNLAAQIGHHDFSLSAAQLEDHLPAIPARRNWIVGVSDHGYANEIARAFGDRFGQRHLLSAKRRAVAGIFNVAAREHAAIGAFDDRADFEVGIRRAGIFSRPPSHFDQFV